LTHLNKLGLRMTKKVLILLDADVVVHLFKAERISLLNTLFEDRVRMLDIVFGELVKNPTVKDFVENLFTYKQIEQIIFPTSSQPEVLKEYLRLKKEKKGDGESACLAYCKHYQHIIASSNTKDIVPYCKANSIEYLTTLDIFAIAISRGKMTNVEANAHIEQITKDNGSYLCFKTI